MDLILFFVSTMNVLIHYDIFGVFYKNTMNYLTTNPDGDVVKHEVDDLLTVPRHLPNTRIPNQHTGSKTIGVQVGHYFWILGGYNWQNPLDSFKVQTRSSLWSLKREIWINGPEVPEGLIKENPCATALNARFAIIININLDTDIMPVQAYDFFKGVWHPMTNPPIFQNSIGYSCSCAVMYEKTYRQ